MTPLQLTLMILGTGPGVVLFRYGCNAVSLWCVNKRIKRREEQERNDSDCTDCD